MKWTIIRKAVLMEDEWHEHHIGQVEAASKDAALDQAEIQFGGGYFHKSDFEAFPGDAAEKP
jgi:hypothetical protein